jgi:uncharacterized OB-fold protein
MVEAAQEVSSVELFPSEDAWIEKDGKVHIIVSKCQECSKHVYPPASFCDNCGNRDGFELVPLSNEGTLYSFSEIHIAPSELNTPYVIGYVDFPEGARVLGQVEHTSEELEVDETVKTVTGVIRTREDGTPVKSFKFRKKEE